jgi:hypothetical protein
LAGALLVLLIEALLGLAFWAGWAWLGSLWGGMSGGLLMVAAVALVLTLALAVDLVADYDSDQGLVDVSVGWLGRFTLRRSTRGDGREIRTRVLFVSWTRAVRERASGRGADEASAARPDGPGDGATDEKPSWLDALRERAEPTSRAVTGVAPALHDLVWGARELSMTVQAPTQFQVADYALAGWFGRRRFGPVEIRVTAGSHRVLEAHYRIRLVRALLAAIAAWTQGQPLRAVRAFRRNPQTRPRRGAAHERT